MKRILISLIVLVFSLELLAGECMYSIEANKDIKVSWKAFKTPLKVGVGGTLKDFTYKGKKEALTIQEIAKSASLIIKTSKKSVHTKNPSRDAKISKSFFSTMLGGQDIEVKIKSLTAKKLILSIKMNGKTLDAPLKYTISKNTLSAKGFIDVLDFGMTKQLRDINNACKAMHEGKTWSDVEISLEANFQSENC